MKTCVYLIGLPRSGTSVSAQYLHENLGIEMGQTFRAPYPGRDDFDYEDCAFTDMIMPYVLDPKKRLFNLKVANTRYVQQRQKAKLSQYWGLKSPLLLLHPSLIPEDALVIKLYREPVYCKLSTKNLPINSFQRAKICEMIDKCARLYKDVKADYVLESGEETINTAYLTFKLREICNETFGIVDHTLSKR